MGTEIDESLREENKQLVRENRKLQRALARQEEQIKRNKISTETKKQFNKIVKAERSKVELNLNLLLANINDYILFFDKSGTLQYCSESFLQAIKVSSIALIKDKRMTEILGDLLPDEFTAAIIKMARDFEKGIEVQDLGVSLKLDFDKSGEMRDYLAEVNILRTEAGGSEGFVLLFYDTTQLERARQEAEQANAAKSDFLATISHEIRTPMNAVIGLTRMIEETDLSERQRDLIGRIKASSTNLLDIINDLLDFSKIEAGKLEIIDDYFDFPELLAGVKSLFSVMMAQKSLIFTCNLAADLPKVVFSDGKRVRQILVNLLNNAYKYTQHGFVTLDVSVLADGQIRFAVTDTGVGIREEESHKLFKEFEQLDQVRNKHVTGTGLGLAITKRICDLMGGRIEVQSVYGEGSTFSVELPLRVGSVADISQEDIAVPQFTAHNARVLIVDDVDVNLEITRYMLAPFAVQSDVAHDGAEAVDMVLHGHFDLVLMDHMMPVMDGVEATQLIREREQDLADNGEPTTHIAIVAQTANAISGVEEMFVAEGFDGFISKPVDANDLARALYKHLPKELIDE